MKLSELCDAAGIKYPEKAAKMNIKGIAYNSENVKKGFVFVCIKGINTDGHIFIKDAVEKGAIAIITEIGSVFEKFGKAVFLEAESTRRALSFLYDAWYGYPSRRLKIIAVTGTNGKTSVTFMLKQIFQSAMYRCGLIGTMNCYSLDRKLDIRSDNPLANMTTPDPDVLYHILAVMAEDGVEFVFMEATSHALHLSKLAPLKFEMAIFTNLSPEHLDFHHSIENYLNAKLKLFSNCKKAIINIDNKYSQRVIDAIKCQYVTCSTVRTDADYRAFITDDKGINGVEYTLYSQKAIFRVQSFIPGGFTVMNSLEAVACALEMQISPKTIKDAFLSLYGIDGRMERVKLSAMVDFSVFIDYAHTPDAFENLLTTVTKFKNTGQRVVMLFGCGGDRDRSKRSEMGRIASQYADLTIVTSDNSRSENVKDIIDEIVSGIPPEKNFVTIQNRAEAIDYAIKNACSRDIIVLAGKGHELYEIDSSGKHPFNEREIVLNSMDKYYSHRRDL